MNKVWIILKHEYLQVVKKKSFVVGLVLTPLLMSGFMILPAMFANREISTSEAVAIVDNSGLGVASILHEALSQYRIADTETPSYDLSDPITIPVDQPERFTEVTDSMSLAVADELQKYVIVLKQGVEVGDSNLYVITNANNFRTMRRFESELTDILASYRLKQSNINLPVDSVLNLTARIDLQTRDTKGESIPFLIKYFAALIFVMLMFSMILNYGQTMMRSVIEEKNSRIMEVLISSVTPYQLMLGKVLGLGAAAFTQVSIWVMAGLAISIGSSAFALDMDPAIARIAFNPIIVGSFVLYFVVGYLMYSTIFALVGSIVNSDKEAQNFIFPITMSLILPVILGMGVIQDPYATWVIVLSYIPLFTPTLMLMRVIFLAPTAESYSLFSGIAGEAVLGLITLSAFTILVIWVTSKVFRVGILMYGKRPNLPEIIRWVRR